MKKPKEVEAPPLRCSEDDDLFVVGSSYEDKAFIHGIIIGFLIGMLIGAVAPVFT